MPSLFESLTIGDLTLPNASSWHRSPGSARVPDACPLRSWPSTTASAPRQLTREAAEHLLARSEADAVSWGQLYIANPDLVRRLRENAPLNTPDLDTFYTWDAHGYTDYPSLDDAAEPADAG